MKKLTIEGHFSRKSIYSTADKMRYYQELYTITWMRINELLKKELNKQHKL